jgi:hypothetical protein
MDNKLGPEGGMALAEALKSNTTLKTLLSAALPSNPPAHAARPFPALRASVHLTPFLVSWKHLNTRPARAYMRPANPCVCLGRVLHAHSPHTACTHTEQVACLPPHYRRTGATHAPASRVDRGHALLCPRVGGERARTLPIAQPARRRLGDNGLGADAEQALRAAARDGLKLK